MSGFQCNLTQSLRFALLTTHHSQKRATLRQQKIVIGCPRKRVNIKSKVFWRPMFFYTAKECEATSDGYLVKCKENGHRTKMMSCSGKIIAIESELKQDGIMAKMTTNNGYCMDFVHYNVHNNCTSHCIDW